MITCTFTEITLNVSQVFIMCVVGVWRHNSEPVVCVCALRRNAHTHTTGLELCRQTPTTHMINTCETFKVISVKVHVITPWWWILCDPKRVGAIFNYVFLKLLYDLNFNIYVLYNWVHSSTNKSDWSNICHQSPTLIEVAGLSSLHWNLFLQPLSMKYSTFLRLPLSPALNI